MIWQGFFRSRVNRRYLGVSGQWVLHEHPEQLWPFYSFQAHEPGVLADTLPREPFEHRPQRWPSGLPRRVPPPAPGTPPAPTSYLGMDGSWLSIQGADDTLWHQFVPDEPWQPPPPDAYTRQLNAWMELRSWMDEPANRGRVLVEVICTDSNRRGKPCGRLLARVYETARGPVFADGRVWLRGHGAEDFALPVSRPLHDSASGAASPGFFVACRVHGQVPLDAAHLRKLAARGKRATYKIKPSAVRAVYAQARNNAAPG